MDSGPDVLKTVSNNTVHKAAEATGEFIGNKITDKIVKPKHLTDEYSRNIEKSYSTRKKRQNIKWFKTSIIKMEHYKIPKLLNESTESKTWDKMD